MSSERRSVVITGIGPVTASGIGIDALLEGLRSGRSPVGPVTLFDSSPFRSHMAAEVTDFDPGAFIESRQARRVDRFIQFSLVSAKLAIEDAGLDPNDVDHARAAVQMGSAMGGIAHAEVQLRKFLADGARALAPRLATTPFRCGYRPVISADRLGWHTAMVICA